MYKKNVMAGNEPDCYIKAGDKLYFGTEIKMGLLQSRIFLPDGTIAEFKNRDIVAYRHHDKLYKMMPVVCNNTDTLCLAMMICYFKSRVLCF